MFVAERRCEEHFTIGTVFGKAGDTYLPSNAREVNALRLMVEATLEAEGKQTGPTAPPTTIFVEHN